jgi:hypothetical protein
MPVLWGAAGNAALYQLPDPARQPAIRRRSSEKSRRGGVFAEPSVGSQFEIGCRALSFTVRRQLASQRSAEEAQKRAVVGAYLLNRR